MVELSSFSNLVINNELKEKTGSQDEHSKITKRLKLPKQFLWQPEVCLLAYVKF